MKSITVETMRPLLKELKKAGIPRDNALIILMCLRSEQNAQELLKFMQEEQRTWKEASMGARAILDRYKQTKISGRIVIGK